MSVLFRELGDQSNIGECDWKGILKSFFLGISYQKLLGSSWSYIPGIFSIVPNIFFSLKCINFLLKISNSRSCKMNVQPPRIQLLHSYTENKCICPDCVNCTIQTAYNEKKACQSVFHLSNKCS